MADVQVTRFNPFNLLDPFNPFAVVVALLITGIIVVALCRMNNKAFKWSGGFLLTVLGIYYYIPNIYAIVMWYLVNKLHWFQ